MPRILGQRALTYQLNGQTTLLVRELLYAGAVASIGLKPKVAPLRSEWIREALGSQIETVNHRSAPLY